MNIALVEYGAGNLPSVERALARLVVASRRASNHEELADCGSFVAVVEQKNVFATQFHPEKSGPVGAQILTNFLRQAGQVGRPAGGTA